ncbi:hypothetical protein SNEBB_004162 [Seison nebaliae]|nr:hypothetical protein SNEBB_004162 [Seison nebaliae]
MANHFFNHLFKLTLTLINIQLAVSSLTSITIRLQDKGYCRRYERLYGIKANIRNYCKYSEEFSMHVDSDSIYDGKLKRDLERGRRIKWTSFISSYCAINGSFFRSANYNSGIGSICTEIIRSKVGIFHSFLNVDKFHTFAFPYIKCVDRNDQQIYMTHLKYVHIFKNLHMRKAVKIGAHMTALIDVRGSDWGKGVSKYSKKQSCISILKFKPFSDRLKNKWEIDGFTVFDVKDGRKYQLECTVKVITVSKMNEALFLLVNKSLPTFICPAHMKCKYIKQKIEVNPYGGGFGFLIPIVGAIGGVVLIIGFGAIILRKKPAGHGSGAKQIKSDDNSVITEKKGMKSREISIEIFSPRKSLGISRFNKFRDYYTVARSFTEGSCRGLGVPKLWLRGWIWRVVWEKGAASCLIPGGSTRNQVLKESKINSPPQ